MFSIKYALERDKYFWFSLDFHMSEEEFNLKIRDKRAYVIYDDNMPIGIMRYNLFWDNIPFLTLIFFQEEERRKGFGKKAVLHWENDMRNLGYKIIMTSTQVDEQAQHFYRKLGYKDAGCLILNDISEQPMEMFLIKEI